MTVKPLIYGYMRVTDDMADKEVRLIEKQLITFADAEGYCLAIIFHEQGGAMAALDELLCELQRSEAKHVVVASLEQLSDHPLLQSSFLREITVVGGAVLHQTANPWWLTS
ncbi:recombinase family protein [Streptacidiphilus sp. P02-A3a]|uniref:recombinase family protein n=1 Tax=Streptacidiphilus sp. P02-A3a TaxID=2704468 RepID=UPI0015F9687E|nr:recombinase family protein [Streptacidiphilus sp. P02-A3a]QMU68905.1 recombinase family protein [Streptacidiphilus sp. P02-A3a]